MFTITTDDCLYLTWDARNGAAVCSGDARYCRDISVLTFLINYELRLNWTRRRNLALEFIFTSKKMSFTNIVHL